jgi:urea transport system ATP-binding protein
MTPDLQEAGAALFERHHRDAASPAGGASFGRLMHAHKPDFAHGVALYLDEISVSFDGFKALNSLSLAIDVGEMRCIIGPNGAG